MKTDLRDVTRLELIDHTKDLDDGGGRTVVFWDLRKQVELDYQDDGTTLKIIVTERTPQQRSRHKETI